MNPSPLFIWDFLISLFSTYHGIFCVKFCHELEWCQHSFTLSHILSHTGEARSSGEPRFLPARSPSAVVTSGLDRQWSPADLQWQWRLRPALDSTLPSKKVFWSVAVSALFVCPSLLAILCPQRVKAAVAGVCDGTLVSLPPLINVLPRHCYAASFRNQECNLKSVIKRAKVWNSEKLGFASTCTIYNFCNLDELLNLSVAWGQ